MNDHDQRLDILLINAKKVSVSPGELRAFLQTKSILLLVSGAVLVLLIGDPAIFSSPVERTFYWSISIMLYLLILPRYLACFNRAWTSITDRAVFHIGPTIPLTIGIALLMRTISGMIANWVPNISGPFNLQILLIYVAIATVLESIGLYWIYPTYRAKNQQVGPIARFVDLNGTKLPLPSIQLVKSDGRYIIVTTKSGTSRHLCRMKNFLEQVDDKDGIAPHRSYWVATNNISRLSGHRIKVLRGADVPVARGKLNSCRSWMRQLGLQH